MNVADRQVGEPDIDRDAPFLLLFQTISVNTGQCFDERSLAVIYMAGRAGDDSLHDPCLVSRDSDHGNLNAPAWTFQVDAHGVIRDSRGFTCAMRMCARSM